MDDSSQQHSSWWRSAGMALLVVGLPLVYGLWNWQVSGPLWPDAPRYANAGAMVADLLSSDGWLHPVESAKQNYATYPAFSVPYHPPLLPLALGLWFKLVGMSYFSARLFMACCWSCCGVLLNLVHRELGLRGWSSWWPSLLLVTTPQLAVWSRDTMSEIPGLVVLLAAACFWLRWLNHSRWLFCLLAWLLLGAAFLTRVSAAGVIPGFLLFTLIHKGWQRQHLLACAVGSIIFLVVGLFWVMFVKQYASYEANADGKGELFLSAAWSYFSSLADDILTSPTAMLALGVVLVSRLNVFRFPLGQFWACWLGAYLLFKIGVATSVELRHFFLGMVSFAGLAMSSIATDTTVSLRRCLLLMAMLALGANGYTLATRTPHGVVGYAVVAQQLAEVTDPGHLLLATWEDQDLIFQFRCRTTQRRYCLRSDRTLAIRLADYAKVEAKILASTQQDVLQLIERGHVALIVTCTSSPEKQGDFRPVEMKLVHETMLNHPQQFELLGEYPLHVDYVEHAHARFGGTVYIWRNRVAMTSEPPRLPIIIPTAKLEIQP